VIALGAPGIHALANPVAIDERLSWYPPAVRGFTSNNCYLLTDGPHALLIDSGATIHRDAVIAQVRALLPGDRLSIAHTRIGEYPAICNTTAIAEQLPVEAVYAGPPSALDWVEFRPRAGRPAGGPSWAIGHPPESRLTTAPGGVALGDGGRRVHRMVAAVRLLPTDWLYDDGTRTLFTADAFTHGWRPGAAGPWTVDDDTPGTSPDEVRDHLLVRCWWMADAYGLRDVQRALEEVFERYDVQAIAPGYGCVIDGRRQVERHYELMQDAIGALGHGSWPA
jgi:hypothetical protein